MADKYDLVIQQGRTFSKVVRWETPPLLYKAITAISKAGPVQITSVGHGVPDGWRVAIASAKGMTQINTKNSPPKLSDYQQATSVSADVVSLNEVNSSDYDTYTSGGYIVMNTPVTLTGFTARMSIKDKIGGTELLRLDTTLVAPQPRIVVDNATKTITLTISAVDTAAITTWVKGVYDLEMVSTGGVVTAILYGNVTVSKEVTST